MKREAKDIFRIPLELERSVPSKARSAQGAQRRRRSPARFAAGVRAGPFAHDPVNDLCAAALVDRPRSADRSSDPRLPQCGPPGRALVRPTASGDGAAWRGQWPTEIMGLRRGERLLVLGNRRGTGTGARPIATGFAYVDRVSGRPESMHLAADFPSRTLPVALRLRGRGIDGMSGGPVIAPDGRVVGVFVAAGGGFGYAIPLDPADGPPVGGVAVQPFGTAERSPTRAASLASPCDQGVAGSRPAPCAAARVRAPAVGLVFVHTHANPYPGLLHTVADTHWPVPIRCRRQGHGVAPSVAVAG